MPATDKQAPPAVLPTGDEYYQMEDSGHRWRVTATSLGGLPEGAVIGIKDLQPGAHLQDLIDREYLTPLTDYEASQLADTAPKFAKPLYAVAPPSKAKAEVTKHDVATAKGDNQSVAATASGLTGPPKK